VDEGQGFGRWLVEEDDYGQPMVFHRHTLGDVVAYIINSDPSGDLAQCSDCLQYLSLSRSPTAAEA
jgi:hypothetical protein